MIFDFLFKAKKGTGAVADPRSKEEKDKDYRAEELAAGAPVWVEKTPDKWRKFTIFDQDGSGSCVAQGISKQLGIENYLEEKKFIELSAKDIYSRRANKDTQGMWGADACNIAIKYGATVRSLMPSDGLNEQQMNDASDRTTATDRIAQIFRAKSWIALPYDIDRIASAIQDGHAVLLMFQWEVSEWDVPEPKITGTTTPFRHAVAGVDFCIYNGKKGIVIDDSWGKNRGINGQRFVSEEWFKDRIFWASYFEDLSNLSDPSIPRPKYSFPRDLTIGDSGDDVKILQQVFATFKDSEGYLFPLTQNATGYFGGITRNAVQRYQKLKNLPSTGFFGPMTREALNTELN